MAQFWSGATVGMLLLLTSGCGLSGEARRDRYLARGKADLAKYDYSRAILEFKNAAVAMPKDPEAYYQLGMSYVGSQDFGSAVVAFRKVIELNPKHVEAQLRIAQLMAETADTSLLKEAERRLQSLLQSTPASSEILNTLGVAALKLGNFESAAESFERALTQSPGELRSYAMLASAKLLEKNAQGAEEVLKKACTSLPRSPDALRLLGEFYVDQNRTKEAEAQLHHALELDGKNGLALIDLAKLQLQLGRKEEAKHSFERLAKLGYRSAYAIFLFQEGNRDVAVQEFEQLVKENPNDRQARTNLVVAYRAQRRFADADHVLAEALKRHPRDTDALLQRAEISIEASKYGEAEADLNEVLRQIPTSPEVHYLMAKVKEAHGATLTYRQELSEALRLNPSLQGIRVELARNLVDNNAAKAAIEVLNAAPGPQKSATPIIVLRNWALWATGDMTELRKGIDLGLSRERSMDLLLQDGLWKLRAANFSGARASLEEALHLNPADVRALAALNQTYVAEKQTAVALQKVKEYAYRVPKSAPVQEFLGVLLVANGDRKQARSAFETAKTADPGFVRADLSLVQMDVAEGKLNEAQHRLELILSSNAANTTARLWLGNVLASEGNQKEAFEQYRQVIGPDSRSAQGLNNYAYLLSEYRNEPDEALKYAQKARELAPDDADYSDTLGWILYRKGLYRLAVTELERAASKQSNAIWKYHLAMAYAKLGDFEHGRGILAAALKQDPSLPEAKLAQQIFDVAAGRNVNTH